jgi:hypothetical protein
MPVNKLTSFKKTIKYLICIAVAAVVSCSNTHDPASSPLPERLTFPGAGTDFGTKGIFDPSLSKDPSSGRIYMSYSAVDPAPTW